MKDLLIIENREYVSSRRAAEITRYSNDYIGQLCRQGKVKAKRVKRAWFVDLEELLSYKKRSDNDFFSDQKNTLINPVSKMLPCEAKSVSTISSSSEEISVSWKINHFNNHSEAVRSINGPNNYDKIFINIFDTIAVIKKRTLNSFSNINHYFGTVATILILSFLSVFAFCVYLHPQIAYKYSYMLNPVYKQISNDRLFANVFDGLSSVIRKSNNDFVSVVKMWLGINNEDYVRPEENASSSSISTIIKLNKPSRESSIVNRIYNSYSDVDEASLFTKINSLEKKISDFKNLQTEQNYRVGENIGRAISGLSIGSGNSSFSFSTNASGLTYSSASGILSLDSNYEISLFASTTNWNDFYNTPSNRITAGSNLSWDGNTLNAIGGGGSGTDVNWSYFNGSGIRLATTSNTVLIGANSTTTSNKLEVIGSGYFSSLLGIGTTSPFAKLSVTNSSLDQPVLAVYGFNSQTSPLMLVASTTGSATSTAFVIDSNGKVGIGTTTPSQELSVAGNGYISGNLSISSMNLGTINGPLQANNGLISATTSVGILYGGTGLTSAPSYGQILLGNVSGQYTLTSTSSLGLLGSTTISSLTANYLPKWNTSSFINSLLYDNGTGIGIGTTSPQGLFDISGSSNSTDLTTFVGSRSLSIINTNTTNNNAGGLAFRTMDVNGLISTGAKFDAVYTSHAANAVSADLAFLTKNAGTISEKMRILSSGNIGIGTTSPFANLSIGGSSGQTTPIFALSTSTAGYATSTAFIILSNGKVGIGTTTPSQELSVAGNALFGVGSSSYFNFNAGLFNYLQAATTTIKDNQPYAWTIATSSTALPLISIQTVTGQMATTSIYSNLNVGSGSLLYDYSSGLSSINGLQMSGTLSFDADAGVVAWTDLPVSAAVAGTPQSYSAQIGGNDILTIYGESAGSGLVQNMRVGIGSTTPFATLSVTGTTSSATSWAFAVADVSSTTRFMVRDDGYVGIGTTSPAATLGINGNIFVGGAGTSTVQNNLNVLGTLHGQVLYSGDLFFANNFSFTEAPLDGTTQGLLLRNQNGQDTLTIDDKGNLSLAGDVCYKGKQCFGKSLTNLEEYVNILASSTAQSLFTAQATTTRNLNELTISVDNINQSLLAMSARIDNLSSTTLEYFASSTLSEALASSTADILASSSPSFIARISNLVIEYIQSSATWVFTKISSALAIFDRVETKTAAVSNGLEMTDQNTNEIYCVQIKNGEFAKTKGGCSQALVASPITPATSSSSPINSQTISNIQTEIISLPNTSIIQNIVSTTSDTTVSTTTSQTVDSTATSSPNESSITPQSDLNMNSGQGNSSNVIPTTVVPNETLVVPAKDSVSTDTGVGNRVDNTNSNNQQPANSEPTQSSSANDSSSVQSDVITNTTN